MTAHAISVRALSFAYEDGRQVLNNLEFSVRAGECVVVAGANGSGKTTVLHILSGVIPNVITGQITGSVQIMGHSTGDARIEDLARIVGLVQQDPESQILFTTVEADCAFAPSNFGMSRSLIDARIGWALDVVSLPRHRHDDISTLSYGQKQRVGIAASMTHGPQILLLDEPFSNVDSQARQRILGTLLGLKNEGKTLVISTHDVSTLVEIADRVLILSQAGHQRAYGIPSEILPENALLSEVGVNPPPMFQISKALGMQQRPLTVKEMCQSLVQQCENMSTSLKSIRIPLSAKSFIRTNESQEPLLEFRHVSFVYQGSSRGLQDVCLTVRRGDCTGIVGPNGSGKSTLLKHIVGLLRPTTGRVLLSGQDVRDFSVGSLARRVGVILQNPDLQLLYCGSVSEEVAHGLRSTRLGESEVTHRVGQALSEVGLTAKKDVYVQRLSFGEKKKLVIAIMLARGPDLLVLDEPFFQLDFGSRTGLGDIVTSLQERGRTVIIASHDIDTLASYADQLVVIAEGRIIRDGPTRQILEDDVLSQVGINPPQIVELAKCLAQHGVQAFIV